MEDCLQKVSSHDVKIVRVGRLAQGASEELENCLLRKVFLAYVLRVCFFVIGILRQG